MKMADGDGFQEIGCETALQWLGHHMR